MSILTVSLNPALDLSTDVDSVVSGPKLRCGAPRFDPGGGGVNVSRAIAKLGGQSLPLLAVGGLTGQMLSGLLESEGLACARFEIDGMTRQSVSVLERSSGKQFRFVLPGPEWTPADGRRLLSTLQDLLRSASPPIRCVVASGSLPPGLPDEFYHEVKEIAERAEAQFVLDTSGRALTAALRDDTAPPHIWVMDQGEAEQAVGHRIADLDALEAVAVQLQERRLADILILSYADGGAIAVSATERHRLVPPKVEILSKVGAGDSFVAGLTLKLSGAAALREAVAFAVAAAASAVTTPATQLCDGPQTERYFAMIMNGQT
jgi:6-phosphofructokinase 2